MITFLSPCQNYWRCAEVSSWFNLYTRAHVYSFILKTLKVVMRIGGSCRGSSIPLRLRSQHTPHHHSGFYLRQNHTLMTAVTLLTLPPDYFTAYIHYLRTALPPLPMTAAPPLSPLLTTAAPPPPLFFDKGCAAAAADADDGCTVASAAVKKCCTATSDDGCTADRVAVYYGTAVCRGWVYTWRLNVTAAMGGVTFFAIGYWLSQGFISVQHNPLQLIHFRHRLHLQ